MFQGPLFVEDDDVATRSPQDVARRTLVLWAVELRAEGVPQKEARQIIDRLGLWEFVSPNERTFLDNPDPSPEESRRLVWRLECLWVFMWALGYIDDLGWPAGMCDVKRLARLIARHENDPKFITEAKLRPVRERLDAQDLTLRIHWAIRDALLHHDGMMPDGLDWSGNREWVPVAASSAAGVVEERHYALNWMIINPLEPEEWDDVDTST